MKFWLVTGLALVVVLGVGQFIHLAFAEWALLLYFAALVAVSLWLGLKYSRNKEYQYIGWPLWANFCLENSALWLQGKETLLMWYIGISAFILITCHDKVAPYFSGIYLTKTFVAALSFVWLSVPVYYYTVALNILSIAALVLFSSLSINHGRQVRRGETPHPEGLLFYGGLEWKTARSWLYLITR